MNKDLWETEIARYLALDAEERWRWLAKLLFALTMFARDTYTVGGEGLDDPERMRRFNELVHRAADQLKNHASGVSGLPDESFAQMVGEEVQALGFGTDDLGRLLE